MAQKKAKSMGKIHKVMSEYKHGTLKSGSGAKVKSRKQAVAIALSEARKAGAHIPGGSMHMGMKRPRMKMSNPSIP